MISIKNDPDVPNDVQRVHQMIRKIFIITVMADCVLVLLWQLLDQPFFMRLITAFTNGVIVGCLTWFVFIAVVRRRVAHWLRRMPDRDE